MNSEDIIRMAREAGGVQPEPKIQPYFWKMHNGDLERFFQVAYAAGAAAEREACAKVCEDDALSSQYGERSKYRQLLATAIRARGKA